MQALAIKYRPKRFAEVEEQDAVKKILLQQLETKTTKNCYLFCGSAGTGKTTSARIFANEINNWKGKPIEIDAASNNGVEQVREIIDKASFKSLDSEYKIYILDEAHMLTVAASNALLKLFEEPPAKTIFILCTTDPQKIIPTILSRVQRYDFQKISHAGIVNRLTYILNAEMSGENELGITGWQPEAVDYIAKLANGGMRDAITMMDKCLSYEKELTVAGVVKALGVANYDQLFNLFNGVCSRDEKTVLQIIDEVYASGVDLKNFVKTFLAFLVDFCKYGICKDFKYINIPPTYSNLLSQYQPPHFAVAKKLIKRVVGINSEIKYESNPKIVIQSELMLEMME